MMTSFMISPYNWGYSQTERKSIYVDRPVFPRGKVLGGSRYVRTKTNLI